MPASWCRARSDLISATHARGFVNQIVCPVLVANKRQGERPKVPRHREEVGTECRIHICCRAVERRSRLERARDRERGGMWVNHLHCSHLHCSHLHCSWTDH